jgi:hypothetical protein
MTAFRMDPPLHLDLDHTGCIARSLDDAAAQWERAGFTLTPVSRQRGAVPGHDGFHPWATANRCAILGNSYLELIGTVDPECHNPWQHFVERGEGLYLVALRCSEADAAYAALAQRTDALRPPVPRERVLDVDGEPRTMRFRNIFSRDEAWPEARYLVIEHQTPEYLWQPRYQSHENGAAELLAVTFVADDVSAFDTRMEAFGASASDAGVWKLPGRGTVNVMSREAWREAYGCDTGRTGMHALTVSVADLASARLLLERRGVEVQATAAGCRLSLTGFVLHLVQEGEHD